MPETATSGPSSTSTTAPSRSIPSSSSPSPESSSPASSSSSGRPTSMYPSYVHPNAIKPPSSGGTLQGLFPPLNDSRSGPNGGGSSSDASSSSSSSPHGSEHGSYKSVATPSSNSNSNTNITPQRIPEKCLTFCSQRADAPSMCRMFCLRKKAVPLSREEELARLRPPIARRDRERERGQDRASISTSPSEVAPSTSTSTSDEVGAWSDTFAAVWKGFTPLQSLKRTLAPYSIIYVRGTADGVVGRYMEELENDDGHRDFEGASRHAVEKKGSEREMMYYSWGEEGSLLHLPLTSIFHPILSAPSTLSFFLTPTLNMLSAYRDSFTSGAQLRNAQSFLRAATDGSAWDILQKLREHNRKRIEEVVEKRKERMEEEKKERERMSEHEQGQGHRHGHGHGHSDEPLNINDVKRDLERVHARAQAKRRAAEQAAEVAGKEKEQGIPEREGEQMESNSKTQSRTQSSHSHTASSTGARSGGLRNRLEEAMERDRKEDEVARREKAERGQAGSSEA